MKGYKGFEPGLICRGKQYAENTTFEEPNAVICKSGMHFCAAPLAVLEYYPPVLDGGKMSEYAEVEALADAKTDDNSIYTTTKLRVGAKISLAKLVEAHVEWARENIKGKPAAGDSNCSAATNTGDCSAATNTGYRSAAEVCGEESVAIVTGRNGKVRGAKGCWLVATERDERYHILCVKTVQVDGVKIKADTWYGLENGEFVEA